MDTSARDITFDANGVCNYCTLFLGNTGHIIYEDPKEKQDRLDSLIRLVKQSGYGKPYDCVVGVSGGVDSSWALVQAVRLGLRPLAVHMDNGWNSELAQNNIENLVRGLKVDLYTHVINWGEYRALMQAFFDADVIDVELLYDNAMLAVNYELASRYGLKYILAGTNMATEGLGLPESWTWFKLDKRNLKAIAKRHGSVKIKTFPAIGVFDYIYYEYVRHIHWTSFLDFFPYNKFDSLKELEKEFGYKRYPFKHYESIFTRFYQGYLLPQKFLVDKRRVHLSTLVVAGQMSRAEALDCCQGIPYPSEQARTDDIEYFLKKMNWTIDDLEGYLKRPEVPHTAYPSEKRWWLLLHNSGSRLPVRIKKYLNRFRNIG